MSSLEKQSTISMKLRGVLIDFTGVSATKALEIIEQLDPSVRWRTGQSPTGTSSNNYGNMLRIDHSGVLTHTASAAMFPDYRIVGVKVSTVTQYDLEEKTPDTIHAHGWVYTKSHKVG